MTTTPAGCERIAAAAAALLAGGHFVDLHLLALVGATLCPAPDPRVELWDAIALVNLDEAERARALLWRLERDPRIAAEARVVLSWSHLQGGDRGAFQRSLAALAPAARARMRSLALVGDPSVFAKAVAPLGADLRRAAIGKHRDYLARRSKRPWLAGTLSALLPGAGQAYAGSWEGAAVALLLNGLSIGATAELAHRELYLSASLTGLAASIFYVGNVINAADLAERRNDRRSEAAYEELQRILAPELYP